METRIIKKACIFILAVLVLISGFFAFITLNSKSNSVVMSEAEKLRYSEYNQLETEDIENCQYVKFGAFFTKDLNGDGVAEKMLGSCNKKNGTDTLYISIGVAENGYLKDGVITVNANNFTYSTELVKDTVLKNNYVSTNTREMELNDVHAGTAKVLMGNIYSVITDQNSYSKINSVTLTGVHVADDEEHTETQISKTIEFPVDWYGTANTYSSGNISKYVKTEFTEGYDVNVSFIYNVQASGLLLQKNMMTITIPQLLGYSPNNVTINATDFEYNSETNVLTVENSSPYSNNTYVVEVTYPKEVYDEIMLELSTKNSIIINSQISAYSLCYNNPNEGFENPYQTNTSTATGSVRIQNPISEEGEIFNIDVNIESKTKVTYPYTMYAMDKKSILDQYDSADPQNLDYIIKWSIERNVASIGTEITIEDRDIQGDYFNNVYLNDCSINTGIYFSNKGFVPDDETITIYDSKTDEIIKTFKNGEWNNYNSRNPYMFDVPIEDIKVVISKDSNGLNSLDVYLKRQFDMEKMQEKITRNQIENATSFNTAGQFNLGGQCKSISDYCSLVSEKGKADFTINRDSIEAGIATPVNQRMEITIPSKTIATTYWKNGLFLIRIPSEKIGQIKINSVESTSSQVQIEGYDFYKEGNYYFIKIVTKNTTPTASFRIVIDHDFLPDTMASSGNIRFELYSQNEYISSYYNEANDTLDIDGDGNRNEKITYSYYDYKVLAPTSFVTSENITNYNDSEEITIAPNIAEISNKQRSAKINVLFANNYTNNVSNVIVLGRIPFQNNKFISGVSLNSEFSTTMKSKIVIPENLEGKATIYYSENGEATNDLEDAGNGWVLAENVTSLDNIKSYLIVVDRDAILRRQTYEFSYEITIPEGVDSNKKAFSCHSIYYDLNTEGGTLPLEVHPNKLGLKVAEYYEFDVKKIKEGTTLAVPGAKYQLKEENEVEEQNELNRIIISNSEGKINLNGLKVNQKYSFKEISAPDNYELNEDEIIFKLVKGTNGLEIEYISEATFGDSANITTINGENKFSSIVEEKPKIGIVLHKVDSKTGDPIDNVVFEIAGQKYTVKEGKINVNGLSLGQEYTVKETYNKGYFLAPEFTFKIDKEQNNTYTVTSTNEDFSNATVSNTEEQDLINVDVVFSNNKIDLYKLQIEKVDDTNTSTKLEGAKYLLKRDDLKNSNYYTTNEEGLINIDDLYIYEEGKSITGKYTIKEIQAPTGYMVNNEEITFVTSKNENGKLQIDIQNKDRLETFKKVEIDEENKTIKITLENSSMLKLTKKDVETQAYLPNVGFVIYELASNGKISDFAKTVEDEYIGTLNENGYYVVYTDENGQIKLPLKNGTYKIMEIEFLEGYKEVDNSKVFKVANEGAKNNYQEVEMPQFETNYPNIQIKYIEDLVDLSILSNADDSLQNKKVVLERDLDFQNRECYKNPDDTSYGDLNGNGLEETIYEELTNVNGKGFTPIGKLFSFDGQNHEIKNLYINSNDLSYVAFINGSINTVSNLGLTGEIKAENAKYVSSVTYGATTIQNCYSKVNLNVTGGTEVSVSVYGVCSGATNFERCCNLGDITVNSTSATVVGVGVSNNVKDVYNRGNFNITTENTANVFGIASSPTSNSYNTGTLVANNANYYAIGPVPTSTNTYYLDSIPATITTVGVAKTETEMKSTEFVELLGDAWLKDTENQNNGYPILNYNTNSGDYILEINKIEDLVKLSNSVKNGTDYNGKKIKLNSDLDFENDNDYYDPTDTSLGDINRDNQTTSIKDELTNKNGYGFASIGVNTTVFNGEFDGQNHKISNFYSSGSYAGLFGYAQNIIVKDLTISGQIGSESLPISNMASGVVAAVYPGENYFDNVHNECNILGLENSTCYVGGIIGESYSYSLSASNYVQATIKKCVIKNCSNKGNITGEYEVGGLVGYSNLDLYIEDCSNTGKINGHEYVGGLVGYHYSYSPSNISIMNSYNTAEVSSTSDYTGGIIGEIYGDNAYISNCYNTGNITATHKIGGIIGYVYANVVKVSDCYNKGDIIERNSSSSDGYGGIVGYFYGKNNLIANCYNEGSLIITDNSNAYVGGIVGYLVGTTTAIYNTYNVGSLDVTGKNIGGIVGYNSGNSLYFEDCYNTSDINIVTESNSYYIGGILGYGNGTIQYSYNIGNITVEGKTGSYIYVSGLGGYGSGSVLTSYNTGNISTIGSDAYYVYCGGLTNIYGSIVNSYNTGNINVSGTYGYVGGIYGYSNNGTITGCYNTGNIETEFNNWVYLGGISSYGGSMNNCFNTGNLKAKNHSYYCYVGGISYSGTISDSYNTGDIDVDIKNGSSSSAFGGIVSTNGNVVRSYNTGNINVYAETTSAVYIGGVLGYSSNGTIDNSYNTGDLTLNGSVNYLYIGGIIGDSNKNIDCSYSVGNIYNYNTKEDAINNVGALCAVLNNSYSINSSYYLSNIQIVSPNEINEHQYEITDEELRSEEFFDSINSNNNWFKIDNSYPKLNIGAYKNGPILNKIEFDNEKAEYDITTEIGTNEFGQKVGGTISGDYSEKYVEGSTRKLVASLNYGEDLDEDIEITPNEGYLISSLKINGVNTSFTEEDSGKTIIKKERFQNVDRNYHIVVTFVEEKNRLTVTKENEEGEPIEGAKFTIEEIEGRDEIGSEYGVKVDNDTSTLVPDMQNEITGKFGAMTTGEQFGFYPTNEEQTIYVSNNYKYSDVTATSYIDIDLTGQTGLYQVVLNAKVDVPSNSYSMGFQAFLTDSTTTPSYTSSYYGTSESVFAKPNRFIASSGTNTAAKDYKSQMIEGGKKYYLHLISIGGARVTVKDIHLDKITLLGGSITESGTVTGRSSFAYSGAPKTIVTWNGDTYEHVIGFKIKKNGSASTKGGMFIKNSWNSNYYYSNIINDIQGEVTGGSDFTQFYSNTLEPGDYWVMFYVTGQGNLEYKDYTDYMLSRTDASSFIGSLTNTLPVYTYVQQEDGSYESNAQNNNYANSYMEVDLSELEGKYQVIIDYVINSNTTIKITDEIKIPPSSSAALYGGDGLPNYLSTIYSTGTGSSISSELEGGQKYYIHFMNKKGNSTSYYSKIKSIKLYKCKEDIFYFDNDNGEYVSNNSNYIGTTAYSYVPIDLTNTYGLYDLTVNAELSGSSTLDYGHIYVTDSVNRPTVNTYSSSDKIFMKTGQSPAADYSITLSAGKMYYVHMFYVKGSRDNDMSDTDCFKINSITLNYNTSDFYREDDIVTDSNGKIVRALESGRYQVTETYAPEEYIIANPVIHTINNTSNNNLTIVDQKKREVIAHYYLKGTGPVYENTPVQLAKDEIKYGLVGEEYTTTPKLAIGDYVLTKTGEDYNIPDNASGTFTLNTINVYYYYEMDKAEYNVHYYYDNIEDTNALVTSEADIGTVISEYTRKDRRGYSVSRTDKLPLTITKDGPNDIYVYYEKNNYEYTVNYFYDEVLEDTVTSSAPYNSVVTTYEDRPNGHVFEKVEPAGEGTKTSLTISDNVTDNVINVYYKTPYDISTGIITHDELYTDGTTKAGSIGGIISGQDDEVYETVLKGDDATKSIQISPNIGYVISGIKIKPSKDSDEGVSVDLSRVVDENGNATISSENGYLTNIDSDKYVEADFRKKSSVIVKYLEADTNNELVTQTTIPGFDNDEFKASISPVANYRLKEIGFGEDGQDTDITGYTRLSLDTDGAVKGNMYSDTLTIVYFYEKIPAGITVKHIEIDEDDKTAGLDLNSGNVKASQDLSGFVSEQESTSRNTYTGYIAVDGPVSNNEDIIIVGKDLNSYSATYKEDVTVEVRYYYEQQFDITVGVTQHTEGESQVSGGTIKFADDSEVEKVNKLGSNEKVIEVIPDSGYRVKKITVNGEEVDLNSFTEGENHVVTIPAGYFTRVQEGKEVKAEFEKIPAKVYIKYVDGDTNTELLTELVDEGFVGDEYTITLREITNYKDNDDHSKLTGTMTEEDIIVIYNYKRLFKITAGVNKHTEWRHTLIELPKDSDQVLTSIDVVGGSVALVNPNNPVEGSAVENVVTEIVERGADSENNIKLSPDTNYKIVSLTKNGDVMTIVDENGFTLDKFENVQEDIEVIVEFERLKGNLVVKYIDMDTQDEIATEERIEGSYAEQYKTYKKDIDDYKYIQSSSNTEGTISSAETVVQYLYRNIRNIPSKIFVKHYVVTDEEIANGLTLESGTVKDTEELNGKVSLTQNTMRKIFMDGENEDYKHLKSVDGPEGTENIIVIDKDTDNYVATYKDEINLEVRYYYELNDANVKIIYTDIETGEILDEEIAATGKVGDQYEVTGKEIPNYRPAETPDNLSGTMDEEEITIIYYYKKIDAKVIMVYTDVDTNEVIEEEIVATGKIGDPYEVEGKDIEGYEPVQTPDNLSGTMDEETRIIYYYKKIENEEEPKDAKVIMVYTDVDTNEVIEEEIVATGKVGDPYDVTDKVKEIEGYEPVQTPDNLEGIMDKEEIRIIYYYKKIEQEPDLEPEPEPEPQNAKVIMIYTDVDTNEVIEKEIVATGKVGDPYEVRGKEITGYKPAKTPDNLKGTMDKEEIVIIYYYKKIVKDVIEEKGGITPEPEGIIETKVSVVYKGIKTGDNIIEWITTLVVSAGVLIIIVFKKLHNKK